MHDNFLASMAVVKKWEGGNDDDPQDPGGRTSRGVIQREYDRYRVANGLPKQDVWKMADGERDAIFEHNYWLAVRGDSLPAGVDLATFDGAVNSGPSQATKWLQRAIGVGADGRFGAETLQVVTSIARNEWAPCVQKICALRTGMLQALKTFKRFGKGWLNRVANVEAVAVGLAIKAASVAGKPGSPAVAASVSDQLNDHASAAVKKADTAHKGAVATGSTGGGVAVGGTTLPDYVYWLVLIVAAVLIGVAAWYWWQGRVHAARANAYKDVADSVKPA
jgi:lysozyme family protein